MADQGRLLVARRAVDRQGPPEQAGVAVAEMIGAAPDLRQSLHRHLEQVAQVGSPRQRPQIHQTGAAGVGGVGDMAGAPRQLPDQPSVDRAQLDLALLGPFPRPRHGVQQPGVFRGREIGVEDQARRRLHHGLMPFGRQPRGHVRRAPVLPDNRPVQRLAGRGVPDDRGLPLVGDAHGGEAIHAARLAHHLATGLQRRAPDLGRVMLDPARLRKVLRQLDLTDGDGAE
ncbi:hypothetical protein D3C72_1175710 [compost metagenome]